MDSEEFKEQVLKLLDQSMNMEERNKRSGDLLDEEWMRLMNKSMTANTPFSLVTTHVTTKEEIPEDCKFTFNLFVMRGIVATSSPEFVYVGEKYYIFQREAGPKKILSEKTELIETFRKAIFEFKKNSKKSIEQVKHITLLLKKSLEDAAITITRDLNSNLLEYIQECSPCIYVLQKQINMRQQHRREYALEQNKLVNGLLFGLKEKNFEKFFNDVLDYFQDNTDSNHLLERGFEIPGENIPNAILIAKINFGGIRTNVKFNEVLSTVSFSEYNKFPDNSRLESSRNIHLMYSLGEDLNMSSEHDLNYLTLPRHRKAVIIPVDQLPFGIKTETIFEQNTTFLDLMLPTGVRLKDPCLKGEGCFPMTTEFRDNSENSTSLSLANIFPFIDDILKDKLEFDQNKFPNRLYSKENVNDITPDGFSCDNELVGKTFLFYHAEESDSPKNKKRKTSGTVSSRAEVATCRTLHLNKYVLQNHYMTKDLIVSNIINVENNWFDISPSWKDLIKNDSDDAQEKRTRENPITDKQWNKYIPNHVSEMAYKKQHAFVEDLVDDVFKHLFKLEKEPKLASCIREITLFVLAVQNKHLKLDIEPPLLKFINPGLGVIWIKPEVVETEPIIVCRPRSYGNLFKTHKTEDNRANKYGVGQDTIPFRNTAIGGSIFVPNAFVRKWDFDSEVIVINPSNKSQTDEELEILKDPKNKRSKGWWPVICPPTLDARMFATANSPVGRLATHFENEIDFQNNFNNPKVNDIKYGSVFTLNPVFSDVFSNINTLVLYPRHVTEDSFCPLNKYLTFNALAARNVDAMINNAERISNLKGNNPDLRTHDAAGENIKHDDDYHVSRLIGSAFPRTCWSDRKLLNNNPTEGKCVHVKEDGSFFIYGVDSFRI